MLADIFTEKQMKAAGIKLQIITLIDLLVFIADTLLYLIVSK